MREERKEYLTARQKEILAMDKRLNELHKLKWSARKPENMIKLDVPRRDGWVRTIVLRDDIARSSEAPKLRKLLDIVSGPQYCDNEEFQVDISYGMTYERCYGDYQGWRHQAPRKRKGHTHLTMTLPILFKELRQDQFDKVPQELKHYFTEFEHVSTWGGARWKTYHVPVTYHFVGKVKPHWITHVHPLYSQIEAEIQILRKKLWDDREAIKWLEKYHRERWWKQYNRKDKKVEAQRQLKEYAEERAQDEEDFYNWIYED
jgi:hypothetical protein